MADKQDLYVITGCGGLGKAIANRLGKKGRLLLSDIVEDGMQVSAAELRADGMTVEVIKTDVANKAEVEALAAKAACLGSIAGLVHTAGVSPQMASWQRVFDVDLLGTAHLFDAFTPLMEPGSAVVAIASMAAHLYPPLPEIDVVLRDPRASDFLTQTAPLMPEGSELEMSSFAYCMAKRGVIMLVQNGVSTWSARGVRINAISPGVIATPMQDIEMEAQRDNIMPLQMAAIGGRRGTADEVAAVVEFLLSSEASYVTGADLLVDGGTVPALRAASLSGGASTAP